MDVSISPIFILPLFFILTSLLLITPIIVVQLCLNIKEKIKFLLLIFSMLVFIFQPVIFKTCFEILSCRSFFPQPAKWVLNSDFTIDCYDKFYFFWIGVIIIPSILFYGFIFPVFSWRKAQQKVDLWKESLIFSVEYGNKYFFW